MQCILENKINFLMKIEQKQTIKREIKIKIKTEREIKKF